MDYKLALQLKEAGYQQKHLQNPKDFDGHLSDISYIPTLEELVDACGDMFGKLEKVNNLWKASYPLISAPRLPNIPDLGSTPTEAVARLWLELNKK
jgi:hypothetical protein